MEPYLLLGVILTAAPVATAGVLLTVVGGTPADTASEVARRTALRAKSLTYWWISPTVLILAGVYRAYAGKTVVKLQHHLELLDEPLWRADELLAANQVDAVLVASVAGIGAGLVFGPMPAVVLA